MSVLRETFERVASGARYWSSLLLDIEPRRRVMPSDQRFAQNRSAYRGLRLALREISQELRSVSWRETEEVERGVEYVISVLNGADDHFDRIEVALTPLVELTRDFLPLIAMGELHEQAQEAIAELRALLPTLDDRLEDRDGYGMEDAAADFVVAIGDNKVSAGIREELVRLMGATMRRHKK